MHAPPRVQRVGLALRCNVPVRELCSLLLMRLMDAQFDRLDPVVLMVVLRFVPRPRPCPPAPQPELLSGGRLSLSADVFAFGVMSE